MNYLVFLILSLLIAVLAPIVAKREHARLNGNGFEQTDPTLLSFSHPELSRPENDADEQEQEQPQREGEGDASRHLRIAQI